MDLHALLAGVSWGKVALLTVLSFAFGALWHSPLMFGPVWLKEIQPYTKPRGGALAALVAAAAAAHLALLIALGALVGSGSSTARGLQVGLGVALFFVTTTLGATYLFAARSLRLFLIDAGFYLVFLALAGVVLAY